MGETTIPLILDDSLSAPEPSKGQREYQAFLAMLTQLLLTHKGQYVAIHNGQVVDSDAEDIPLILRVHKRIGYVPIHVGLVTELFPVVRIPRYREYRAGEGS